MLTLNQPPRRKRRFRYLSTGLTRNVLNNYTTKSPLFYATADDASVPVERLKVDKISTVLFYAAADQSM